jgi:hypothetical protein
MPKVLKIRLSRYSNELKELHQFTKEMEHYLTHVERRLKRSVQVLKQSDLIHLKALAQAVIKALA